MSDDQAGDLRERGGDGSMLQKPVDRRNALGMLVAGAVAGAQALGACVPLNGETPEEREVRVLAWREYIKGNYRFMTDAERAETITRLEELARLKRDEAVTIQSTGAQPGVVFGYAFNISKCQGFRNCIEACINENNLDREADTQYIRIFEMSEGEVNFRSRRCHLPARSPGRGPLLPGDAVLPVCQPSVHQCLPRRRHLAGARWHRGD